MLDQRHRHTRPGTTKAGGNKSHRPSISSGSAPQREPTAASRRLTAQPGAAKSPLRPRLLRSGFCELTQNVLRHASMTKLAEIGMPALQKCRSGAYRPFKYRFRSVGEAPTSTSCGSDSYTETSGSLAFSSTSRMTRVLRNQCRQRTIPPEIVDDSRLS